MRSARFLPTKCFPTEAARLDWSAAIQLRMAIATQHRRDLWRITRGARLPFMVARELALAERPVALVAGAQRDAPAIFAAPILFPLRERARAHVPPPPLLPPPLTPPPQSPRAAHVQ